MNITIHLDNVAEYHDTRRFANGRGASVIRSAMSYGGRDGLYEVAVLDRYGRLDYSTPITGDVIGYLTMAEVNAVCDRIAAL